MDYIEYSKLKYGYSPIILAGCLVSEDKSRFHCSDCEQYFK